MLLYRCDVAISGPDHDRVAVQPKGLGGGLPRARLTVGAAAGGGPDGGGTQEGLGGV